MSHSPLEIDAPSASYLAGWSAVNKLLRRGHSWSGHEHNCAYLNTGERFADVSAVTGLDLDQDGRAVARVDWDDDGDLDLFAAARTGPRLRYLRNNLPEPDHSLSIELVGTRSNRDAIGARVELHFGEGEAPPHITSVRAGEGFLAQSSKRVHFGLGAAERPAKLRVHWPRPAPDNVEEFDLKSFMAAGTRRLRVTEGAGIEARPAAGGPRRELPSSLPLPQAASGRARVVLAAPLPMPELHWQSAGIPKKLFGVPETAAANTPPTASGPILVTLWASWCAPCIGELRDFTKHSEEFSARGLRVLALSLDDAETLDAARLFLHNLAWPFAQGEADPGTIDLLDVLRGILLDREDRLPVPTSFLVDPDGRLRVLYIGPVTTETVLNDVELCYADGDAQRAAAVPFAGRWRVPAWDADLGFFEGKLLKRGYRSAARQFHIGQLERTQTSNAELHWRFGRTLGEAGRNEEAAEHLRSALAADPYLLEAWSDLAVVLYQAADYDGAADAYSEALRLEPDSAQLIYDLGLTHLRRSDLPAAEHQATRLRALADPRSAELESWIARMRAR